MSVTLGSSSHPNEYGYNDHDGRMGESCLKRRYKSRKHVRTLHTHTHTKTKAVTQNSQALHTFRRRQSMFHYPYHCLLLWLIMMKVTWSGGHTASRCTRHPLGGQKSHSFSWISCIVTHHILSTLARAECNFLGARKLSKVVVRYKRRRFLFICQAPGNRSGVPRSPTIRKCVFVCNCSALWVISDFPDKTKCQRSSLCIAESHSSIGLGRISPVAGSSAGLGQFWWCTRCSV